MIINFKRVRPDAKMWEYAHPEDACMDMYAAEDFYLTYKPKIVPTGIAVSVPRGYVGDVRPRSGLSSRGIIVVPGTIDPGYTGEVNVIMYSVGCQVEIKKGTRIAQFCLVPCPSLTPIEIDELPKIGSRGKNGFGSTGYAEI